MEIQKKKPFPIIKSVLWGATLGLVAGVLIARRRSAAKTGMKRVYDMFVQEVEKEAMDIKDLTEAQYKDIVEKIGKRFSRMKGVRPDDMENIIMDLKRKFCDMPGRAGTDSSK